MEAWACRVVPLNPSIPDTENHTKVSGIQGCSQSSDDKLSAKIHVLTGKIFSWSATVTGRICDPM